MINYLKRLAKKYRLKIVPHKDCPRGFIYFLNSKYVREVEDAKRF